MGIPSYFSFIIRNHHRIIRKLGNVNVQNLYLDSNSIIYDSIRGSGSEHIINSVCLKIEEYIREIRPDNNIFIAFDGVAPVAKLEQQRNRRYKSSFERDIKKSIMPDYTKEWDTSAITPGTDFMERLGRGVEDYFIGKERLYGVKNIIVSTSNEVGEGEHKIFDFIRNNDHSDTTSVIYGLDADLIMLCLNHLAISPKLYLFRETPEFVKSIRKELNPNETYILDIPMLANVITREIGGSIQDYIFLCFFLGNDFLPHFPSVNIRTTGIHIMMNAYKQINCKLTCGKEIIWKNVRKLIEVLAAQEHDNLTKEYKLRDKWEKRKPIIRGDDDVMSKYLTYPIFNRDVEKAIAPHKPYWNYRYYKELFNLEISDDDKNKICTNYLEGLEWTFNYYSDKCIDWRWTYKYNYPPLFKDLLKYVPFFETNMIEENNHKAVDPLVQLSYVLPASSLYILPKNVYQELCLKRLHYYPNDANFCWAFCKYMWEAHVELPKIDIKDLECFIYEIQSRK